MELSYLLRKPDKFLEFQTKLYGICQKMALYNVSENRSKDLTDTITSQISLKKTEIELMMPKAYWKTQKDVFVIAEYLQKIKRTTSNDRLSICDPHIQITKSLQILEVVLTSRGKDLKPFWTKQSEEISKKLWLPTKTDSADLALKSLNILSKHTAKGGSWFLITRTYPQNPNLQKMCYKYSPSSPPESTDCVNTAESSKKKRKTKETTKKPPVVDDPSKPPKKKQKKRKVNVKAMKFRLFPTDKQKEVLTQWFGMTRWFYNRTVDHIEANKRRSFNKIDTRNKMRNTKTRKYDIPEWCLIAPPPKVITGAIRDCCKDYESANALLNEGYTTHYNIKYRSKKDNRQNIMIELNAFDKKCNSNWFPRTKLGDEQFKFGHMKSIYRKGRKCMTLDDLDFKINDRTKGHDCRLISETIGRTTKYFLFVSVDVVVGDKQTDDVISLDSGIRTFQTGYSPSYHTIEIGKDTAKVLSKYIIRQDSLRSYMSSGLNKRRYQRCQNRFQKITERIHNLVNELHWKSINYLVNNYGLVLLSDFRVSELLKKHSLNKWSKRIMTIQQHYKFKQRLTYKCKVNKVKLVVADESYTSKTCTNCGHLHNTLGANKTYECPSCSIKIDRDENGARNLLLKHWNDLPLTEDRRSRLSALKG